jgi:hypothetical protein
LTAAGVAVLATAGLAFEMAVIVVPARVRTGE